MTARGLALLVLTVLWLAMGPTAASNARQVGSAGRDFQSAPMLTGASVSWLDARCVEACGPEEVDCEQTYNWALRLASPHRRVRTLTRGSYGCGGSGPNSGSSDVSFAVSGNNLARLDTFSGSDEFEGESGGGTLRAGRVGGGLSRVYACRWGGDGGAANAARPFVFALDRATLAYEPMPCVGNAATLAIRDLRSGKTETSPEPPNTVISQLAVAGRYVAILRDGLNGTSTVALHDSSARREAYAVALSRGGASSALSVQQDGTVGLLRTIKDTTDLCNRAQPAWFSRAEPQEHLINAPACAGGVRVARDRLFFVAPAGRGRTLRSVGLDGRGTDLVRFGRVDIRGFDSDGTRIAYAARSCNGRFAIFLQRLSGAPASVGSPRCPANVAGTRLGADSHRRVRVLLRCPHGCDGVVSIRRGRRTLGRRSVELSAGPARAVIVRLRGSAARGLRRAGSERVAVTLVSYDRGYRRQQDRRLLTLDRR